MAGTTNDTRRRLTCALAAAIAAVAAWLIAAPSGATAATFNVNKFEDAVDADIGDGVCLVETGGCTLRAAIQEAEGFGGADIVNLPAASTSTLGISLEDDNFELGVLKVTTPITVTGGSGRRPVIDADGAYSIFQVANGGDLTLDHVRVEDGYRGLTIYAPGGSASATVTDSVIAANSGGGIFNGSSLVVRDSAIIGNSGPIGGAIYVLAGTTTIDRSQISGNGSTVDGYGVIEQSYDLEPGAASSMSITNSTIAGNSDGVNVGFGSATITHSTFADQTAAPNLVVSDGAVAGDGGSISLNGSIVRDAAGATACSSSGTGAITGANNVIGDASCTAIADGIDGNLTGVTDANIGLSPLAENGGATQTMALAGSSVAIDRGGADCSPPPVADVDQRSIARPQGAGCDSGAFERGPVGLPATLLLSGPSDGATVGTATVAFSFSSAVGNAFQCRFHEASAPKPEFTPCASPIEFTPGDGDYSFDVRATDQLGQSDPSPAYSDFTIDTVPPDIGATGPSGRIADSTPTYELSGPSDLAQFHCTLDGGAEFDCATPYTTPELADGAHTLSFGGIDQGGLSDPAPEQFAVVVDTTLSASIAAVGPRRSAAGGKIKIKVACEPDEAASGCEVLGGSIVSAKKVKVKKRGPKKKLTIAKLTGGPTLAPGLTTPFELRILAKSKAPLKRLLPLQAVTSLRIRDEVGNVRTVTLRSRLKP